nr:hypothetical protein [Tanacetum cinerariifolium]
GCKNEFGDDNDQEGLVKLVDDLCIKEHISGNVVDAKVVDEKVLDDKVLDEMVLDAKVYAGVGVDVHVDNVQCAQKPPLNEFIKSVSAVSDVFHQVVAFETHHCPGEGSGFIYADSQDQFLVFGYSRSILMKNLDP